MTLPPIQDNSRLGRQVSEKDKRPNALSFVRFKSFMDRREQGLSLDRLGLEETAKSAETAKQTLAEQGKDFHGWNVVHAEKARMKGDIVPDPIEKPVRNDYHTLLMRHGWPDDKEGQADLDRVVAQHLAHWAWYQPSP